MITNPDREDDPFALPDVEVFEVRNPKPTDAIPDEGWYWWSCFPGCLPDSEPIGPFKTEAEALADAQNLD